MHEEMLLCMFYAHLYYTQYIRIRYMGCEFMLVCEELDQIRIRDRGSGE